MSSLANSLMSFSCQKSKESLLFEVELIKKGLSGPVAGLSQQALTIYYPTRGERQAMAMQSVLNNSVVDRPLSIIYWTD